MPTTGTRYVQSLFENVDVPLDNAGFENCRFENCTMVYSGHGPVSFSGCVFANVRWVLTGPAQNTMFFLRGLYHGAGDAGRQLVENTFEMIRTPELSSPSASREEQSNAAPAVSPSAAQVS